MPRYIGACPFKPGDLVTPRAESTIMTSECGKPYLVIEVAAGHRYNWTGDFGTFTYGFRTNMRVMSIKHDVIVPMWQDSAEYEAYIGPGCSQ